MTVRQKNNKYSGGQQNRKKSRKIDRKLDGQKIRRIKKQIDGQKSRQMDKSQIDGQKIYNWIEKYTVGQKNRIDLLIEIYNRLIDKNRQTD